MPKVYENLDADQEAPAKANKTPKKDTASKPTTKNPTDWGTKTDNPVKATMPKVDKTKVYKF